MFDFMSKAIYVESSLYSMSDLMILNLMQSSENFSADFIESRISDLKGAGNNMNDFCAVQFANDILQ